MHNEAGALPPSEIIPDLKDRCIISCVFLTVFLQIKSDIYELQFACASIEQC